MDKKDISIIQDSKIAMQVINRAFQNDKGLVFLYIDNRQAAIDSKSIETSEVKQKQPKQIENKEIFPNVTPSEIGKIPEFLKNELEHVIKKFPQPILGHVIKSLFEIAYGRGITDKERGQFLGIGPGKYQHWKKKFKLGGTVK